MSDTEVTYFFRARLKGAPIETTLRSQVALVGEVQAVLERGDMFRVVCRRKLCDLVVRENLPVVDIHESLWAVDWFEKEPNQHGFVGNIYHPDARALGFDTVRELVEARMKKQPQAALQHEAHDWRGLVIDASRLLHVARDLLHASLSSASQELARTNFMKSSDAWLEDVRRRRKDEP